MHGIAVYTVDLIDYCNSFRLTGYGYNVGIVEVKAVVVAVYV